MLKQRSAEIVSSGSFLRVVNSAMPRSSMALEDRALEHVFDYLKKTMHVRPAYGIALRGVSLLVRFDPSDSRSDIRDSLVFSLRGAAWVTLSFGSRRKNLWRTISCKYEKKYATGQKFGALGCLKMYRDSGDDSIWEHRSSDCRVFDRKSFVLQFSFFFFFAQ